MNELIFYARRTDGLGERLRALLNAIALSKVYDAKFKFTWKENHSGSKFHTTETADRIFSKNFINSHLVDPVSILDCKNVSEFLKEKTSGSFFCDQTIPVHEGCLGGSPSKLESFIIELKKAFWTIEFSDFFSEAIEYAQQVKIDNSTIALHLRAGDLVYDGFKHTAAYLGKAIPYPIAESIIAYAKANGYKVIIFGQDAALLKYLSNKWSVVLSCELMPFSMQRVEASIFDAVLMSRCAKIYAGNSGFSVLSSIIGGGDYVHYFNYMKRDERVKFLSSYLLDGSVDERVPSAQVAYASKAALVEGFGTLENSAFSKLIEVGQKSDPSAVIFDFLKAWRFYMKHEFSSGDLIVEELLQNKKSSFAEFIEYNTGSPHQRKKFSSLFKLDVISDSEKTSPSGQIYTIIKKNIEKS